MGFLDREKNETRITKISDIEELSPSKAFPSVSQRLIVLEIMFLLNRSLSSYELYNELRSKFGVRTSYGTIYPWLRQLERSEIVSSELVVRKDRLLSQQKKRLYRLTNLGRAEFEKSVDSLDLIMSLLQEAFPQRNTEIVVRASTKNRTSNKSE
jgi:DNA-binding PadR family transcriptional regulator